MPDHGKGEVIVRQWEMLRLIPAHGAPGRSAGELSASLERLGYRVSLRTVERDLEALARCMPLETDVTKRPQRWRWRRQRRLDIPGMEVAEAMALFMMRDAIEHTLPECFGQALQTRFAEADNALKTLARSGRSVRWSDRVRIVPSHITLCPPRVSIRILQTLQKALLGEIAVEADYQSLQEGEPRRRVLYPRALLLRGSALYLIAHQKEGGAEPHHYAVQRFSAVRLQELEPWPAERFSLDVFMADGRQQFGEGRNIRLRATVVEPLYKILRDTPLSADMRIENHRGDYRLAATVRDTWALHSWILGHGENIRVESPESLKDLIARRMKAAASQYV